MRKAKIGERNGIGLYLILDEENHNSYVAFSSGVQITSICSGLDELYIEIDKLK